ncbi:MAG: tRNA (adenosine(37)-N6)-threonylcarbamoyltransferase complex dimerization subunit type 1 TsaB [Ectothiorhodospiraceae bacterium]|nr:tRNA (adenosine(37)-N6)-threonylcarbamoyltransferase complex dimerization subunit type 1 TsaB [Ectothiorhodospiraceae bacterium]MCH8504159.1 tRNA (adenosine(37)-N6)-threonylcarbamoyltransferase complex dimerization subunit type 1 TsaB [Ectothiorhodospiraceae bacterium]
MTAHRPILALDASTEACSAALLHQAGTSERFAVMPRGHAQNLIEMLDSLLVEAGLGPDDLRLVVYGRGPGAFTGVRIGVGVAQGLAFGSGAPVHGVSTLALVAQGCHRRTGAQRVLVAMDARMGEVYWACYSLDPVSALMSLQGQERVDQPEQVRPPVSWADWAGAGTGWEVHGEALQAAAGVPARLEVAALPEAVDALAFGRRALQAGDVLPASEAAPVYLRDRVTG